MKILLCIYHELDCGLDNLYDGLCRAVGYENVYEYPTKPSLHGKFVKKYSWYPLFFDYPVVADDDTKINMLKKGEFDLILYSNRQYQLIRTGYKADIVDKFNRALDVIKENLMPICVLDMNDGSAIDYDLIDFFNPLIYFKRDYLKDSQYDSRIVPLNFCYSEKYVPSFNDDRIHTLLWVGRLHCGRTKYINACKSVSDNLEIVIAGRAEAVYNQKKYSEELLRFTMSLNLVSYGYDNLRYYEIPAHRTLLVSQKLPIVIENDYKDMENAVFFDSMDELKSKLKYCLDNRGFVNKARLVGYEHFLKYHTTKARALQLLDKVKNLY
jgi:hypothetical protein